MESLFTLSFYIIFRGVEATQASLIPREVEKKIETPFMPASDSLDAEFSV